MAGKTRKGTSRRKKKPTNRVMNTVVILGVLVLGFYYLLTGGDPFALFTPVQEVPQSQTIPSEEPLPEQADSGDVETGDSAPKTTWWQVYFTNPNRINDPENLSGSIAEKLIGYIDNADDSIHIASFEFNLTPVAEALILAKRRGVEVKWVTDDEHGIEADEEEGHGQFEMLEKAGIEIKADDRGALMHNKFWIFDENIVWTGSTNITVNGNFKNNNNVIVIESPELAVIYEREFEEMWAGEFGPRSPSTMGEQSITVSRTPVQVLFSPEDEVMDTLIEIVSNAQTSIRFMAFSFTFDSLGDAFLERAKDGVDVQGIFETRGSETEFSELAKLFCAGVPVLVDGNPRTFHHKVIVIDDKYLVTGSLNFSNNASESNDENVIVISSKTISGKYIDEFERRWNEGREPDPADLNCN